MFLNCSSEVKTEVHVQGLLSSFKKPRKSWRQSSSQWERRVPFRATALFWCLALKELKLLNNGCLEVAERLDLLDFVGLPFFYQVCGLERTLKA